MQSRKKVPRFKREAPEKRRADLVQAAIRCLAEGGMAAFKMERIAAEAGVSLGLLPHYFKSKTELLTEVYRAALYEDVNRKIADLDDKDAPDRRLNGYAGSSTRSSIPDYLKPANLTVWLALWGEIVVNPELRLAHRTLYRSYLKSLAALIGEVAEQRQRTCQCHRDRAQPAGADRRAVPGARARPAGRQPRGFPPRQLRVPGAAPGEAG